MMTGSEPTITVSTMRARGFRPSSFDLPLGREQHAAGAVDDAARVAGVDHAVGLEGRVERHQALERRSAGADARRVSNASSRRRRASPSIGTRLFLKRLLDRRPGALLALERELVELLAACSPTARRSSPPRDPAARGCSCSMRLAGRRAHVGAHRQRVMLSTPPATTRSCAPDCDRHAPRSSPPAGPEPQKRFSVTPGTSIGQPAASTAARAMFAPCSPVSVTQPTITSSTSCGSIPVRSTIAFIGTVKRSIGWTPARLPFRRPRGVRQASMM